MRTDGAAGGSNRRPLLARSAIYRRPPSPRARATDRTRRVIGGAVGRYDLDVPAAVRDHSPAFFNAAGTDARLRVTFPAVSCAVIKNLIGPPPGASRQPFWPGARLRQGHKRDFTLPHHV
jgi:hypothetical protein